MALLPESSQPSTAQSDATATLGNHRFTQALKFLQEAARSTPVVIHVIPLMGQTVDSDMDKGVKQFAAETGWPLVQEYGAFVPSDYFAQDGHWVASGHV